MSSSGYYKRYQDHEWREDCDTLIKPVIVAGCRIGYFITECRPGNKEVYLSFRPEMKKKFKDGSDYRDLIFGPSGYAYSWMFPIVPGKYFIQRAKEYANKIPVEPTLLRYWNECLNNQKVVPQ